MGWKFTVVHILTWRVRGYSHNMTEGGWLFIFLRHWSIQELSWVELIWHRRLYTDAALTWLITQYDGILLKTKSLRQWWKRRSPRDPRGHPPSGTRPRASANRAGCIIHAISWVLNNSRIEGVRLDGRVSLCDWPNLEEVGLALQWNQLHPVVKAGIKCVICVSLDY